MFIEGKKTVKEQQRYGYFIKLILIFCRESSYVITKKCRILLCRSLEVPHSKSASNSRCSSRLSKSPVVSEEPSCPDYPDDFEESSSDDAAEYSDDFDDGEGEASLKEPMAAKAAGLSRVGADESYSDDEFEQDSDSEVAR